MSQLIAKLNYALESLSLEVEVKRVFGENKSAGFKIIDRHSKVVKTSIDINLNSDPSSRMYQIGNVMFNGVMPDSVVSDKICAISSNLVFRRAKDLLDLYALAHCVKINTTDILQKLTQKNLVIDSFNEFITRQKDLKHAYDKLVRIDFKPDFSTVYSYLSIFLTPFIEKNLTTLIWNSHKMCWTGSQMEISSESRPETLQKNTENEAETYPSFRPRMK
ncbi:MAG: hypothetical protein LBS60_06930 [Deltaproteobacteria bacterium]|nr:hypothetical protein [Deltaproteobacteria bacterium]